MDLNTFLNDYLYKGQIQEWLRFYEEKVSGNMDVIIDRLVSNPSFDLDDLKDVLLKDELQVLADYFDIPRSGTKAKIWDDLREIIDELLETEEYDEVEEYEEEDEDEDLQISQFYELAKLPYPGEIGEVPHLDLAKKWDMPVEEADELMKYFIMEGKIKIIKKLGQETRNDYADDIWIVGDKTPDVKEKAEIKEDAEFYKNEEQENCLFCGNTLEKSGRSCPSCGEYGMVRNLPLKQGDDWTTCYNCNRPALKKALMEWLKINQRCPSCKKKLNSDLYSEKLSENEIAIKIRNAVGTKLGLSDENDLKPIADNSGFILERLVNVERLLIKSTGRIDERFDRQDKTAQENHQSLLQSLQPIAQEITMIAEFNSRWETLTKDAIREGLSEISNKFDVLEDKMDLLVEVHRKNNSVLTKVKNNIIGEATDYTTDMIVERSGLKEKFTSYFRKPNREDLSNILGKIKEGLNSRVSDPKAWLKLASMLLVF